MEIAEQSTVQDYLKWRGDLPFGRDPFNEVDNLVLCILAYLNYSRFPEVCTKLPQQAVRLADIAPRMTGEDEQLGLSDLSYLPVMRLAAQSERFGDVKLLGYESKWDEEQETQFQAVSYLLPDETLFISYMGTDRSIAGWKEDFNMSFLASVPAQREAMRYAQDMVESCPGRPVRMGGHSKGGNLAAWAAIHLPQRVQDQLLSVYNNDGPGFSRTVADKPEYIRIRDKLYTFIPESSIIGVLLDHAENYTVIDSVNRSVLQHEALSWCCLGNKFVYLGERSQMGKLSDGVLQEWIGSLSSEERREFSDVLFEILSGDGKYQTLDDLRAEGFMGYMEVLKGFIGADEEKRKVIVEVFRRLAIDVRDELSKAARRNLGELTKRKS